MTEAAYEDTPEPVPVLRAVPDPDEQQAAREWADEQAERIGNIWLRRFPSGKDWVA
jgi:hypothetical protein